MLLLVVYVNSENIGQYHNAAQISTRPLDISVALS